MEISNEIKYTKMFSKIIWGCAVLKSCLEHSRKSCLNPLKLLPSHPCTFWKWRNTGRDYKLERQFTENNHNINDKEAIYSQKSITTKQKCFPKTAPDKVSQTKAQWGRALHWSQWENKSNVNVNEEPPQFHVSSHTPS